MDVLTDVLNSVRLSGEVICRFELSSPWGVSIPTVGGASFHVIDRGSGWLRFQDGQGLVPLAGGDLVVFPKGRSHEIVDAPESLSLPFEELISNREQDSLILSHGGGGTPTTIICGVFHFQGDDDHPLFSVLPPLIHIKGDQGRAVEWLDTTLKFMSSESGSPRPGADTIIGRLTDVLFIQAVRAWMDGHKGNGGGWLTALGDSQIGPRAGGSSTGIRDTPGPSALWPNKWTCPAPPFQRVSTLWWDNPRFNTSPAGAYAWQPPGCGKRTCASRRSRTGWATARRSPSKGHSRGSWAWHQALTAGKPIAPFSGHACVRPSNLGGGPLHEWRTTRHRVGRPLLPRRASSSSPSRPGI